MHCTHCGKENADGNVFCSFCGASLAGEMQAAMPAVHLKAQKPEKKANVPAAILGAVSLVLAVLIALMFTGVIRPSAYGGSMSSNAQTASVPEATSMSAIASKGTTIEGPGFETPEDAAKAYLEALRDQNIDQMVSTFAIESYVKSYDFEALLERLMSYQPTQEIRLPSSNVYAQQLNIVSRRGQILSFILYQYLLYQTPDEMNSMKPTVLRDAPAAQDFAKKFVSDTTDYVFADLAVTGILRPESVSEIYSSAQNQNNIARQAKTFGVSADDLANTVITFTAGGKTWLFCPQAVRYNGRWYLQALQGNLANLLGMSVYMGGIAPAGALGL